jgi:hypothetical protein
MSALSTPRPSSHSVHGRRGFALLKRAEFTSLDAVSDVGECATSECTEE